MQIYAHKRNNKLLQGQQKSTVFPQYREFYKSMALFRKKLQPLNIFYEILTANTIA